MHALCNHTADMQQQQPYSGDDAVPGAGARLLGRRLRRLLDGEPAAAARALPPPLAPPPERPPLLAAAALPLPLAPPAPLAPAPLPPGGTNTPLTRSGV